MDILPQAVLFIHGKGKKAETWNVSEFGKKICIEESLKKSVHTMMLQIDDFTVLPSRLVDKKIGDMRRHRWTIVSHSLGVMYIFELLGRDIIIDGFCLIDPTPFTSKYIETMKTIEISDWIKEQLIIDIAPKIIFHVHISYPSPSFEEKIDSYSKFTRKNDKSKVILHNGKGHMIHYTDAPKIIDSINDLLKKTK